MQLSFTLTTVHRLTYCTWMSILITSTRQEEGGHCSILLVHVVSSQQLSNITQGVWSEEDSCVSQLAVDMEYLSSPQRMLEDVLERAANCVTKSGVRVGEEEGSEGDGGEESEEEMEDDFDDYYGMDEEPDTEVHEKERWVRGG